MAMKTIANTALWHGLLVAMLLVIGGVLFFNNFPRNSNDNLYTLSAAERNDVLFNLNEKEDYAAVVTTTNFGIKNHKGLVWDDADFWTHRGFAFYKLGQCTEAAAAFYHASMRDIDNEISSNFLAAIGNGDCKPAVTPE